MMKKTYQSACLILKELKTMVQHDHSGMPGNFFRTPNLSQVYAIYTT